MEISTHHHFSDNLYAKEMFLPKGSFALQHKHTYSHLSILAKGKVVVGVEGDITEYTAPACINIEANLSHGIQALEDSVWYCIHSTDETNIDKIDEVLIAEGV